MKRGTLLIGSLLVIVFLGACGSMPIPGVSVNLPGPNVSGAAGIASAAETMDFKKDEVLCLAPDQDPLNGTYYLGRVITPASKETKNQAEVIFVEDGTKNWSSKIVLSRKVGKSDLAIGTLVFYPAGWQNHDKMSQEDYRFAPWKLGRVTNNDELFKNMVEVAGESFNYALIRIPLEKVE